MIYPKFKAMRFVGSPLELFMEHDEQARYEKFIKTLPRNEDLEFTVKPWSKNSSRSQNQNRYMWSVVYGLISEELGYAPEEVHEICKMTCNFKIINIGGKERRIAVSTASLKTNEMEDYLRKIREWASQKLGLYIPLPNETSY